jgi:hypothetical protein
MSLISHDCVALDISGERLASLASTPGAVGTSCWLDKRANKDAALVGEDKETQCNSG